LQLFREEGPPEARFSNLPQRSAGLNRSKSLKATKTL
jgi:hypothetical protein